MKALYKFQLGKHSEVYGKIDAGISLITKDEEVLQMVKEFKLESGYNPLYTTLMIDSEFDTTEDYIFDKLDN